MKTILTLLTLFVFTASLQAQRYSGENLFPQQANITHNQAVMNFSRDFVSALGQLGGILPSGADMVGDASQVARININGNGNAVSVDQNGTLNYAGINIFAGNNNSVDINQDGTDNFAEYNITGNNNQFSLLQRNNNNIFRGFIFGSNLNPAPVIQMGGTEALQLNATFIPLQISTTSGRGVPVIIQPGN